ALPIYHQKLKLFSAQSASSGTTLGSRPFSTASVTNCPGGYTRVGQVFGHNEIPADNASPAAYDRQQSSDVRYAPITLAARRRATPRRTERNLPIFGEGPGL